MSLARVVSVCQYGFASKDLATPTASDGGFSGLPLSTSRDIRELNAKAWRLCAAPSLKPFASVLFRASSAFPMCSTRSKNLWKASRCSQQCKTFGFGVSAALGLQGITARGIETLLHTSRCSCTMSHIAPYSSGLCCIRITPCAIIYSDTSLSLRMPGRIVQRFPRWFLIFLHVLVPSCIWRYIVELGMCTIG